MPEFPVAGGYQDEPPSVAIGVVGTLTDREFKSDFYASETRLDDGLSLERRPDAIALDYLTAFSLGPIQLGDFSAGPINRAWKIRVSGNTVYSSRQNDTGDDFEPEQIVFTFTGVGATEIDVAFDQSAHILVCMERPTGVGSSSEIWIYYYDPFITNFALTNFGRGRTPRAVLDDILDSSNADILVFYLADSVGMCWRQQRERYSTERVVNQVVPVIPSSGSLTMKGPATWAYDFPPDVTSGFLNYTIHLSEPTPYTGAAMDAFTAYPRNLGVSIACGGGTLRIIEETGGKPVAYPGSAFSGILEDNTFIDYGLWVAHRDFGATIRFNTTVYYAEIQAFKSFFGGAKMQALKDNVVVSQYVFAKNTDPTTRELGIVYHQFGFDTIILQPSAGDSTNWSNFRYSESQLPGPLVPTQFDYPNTYLEDVYKATSGRVVIIYSVRDPILGRYTLHTIATVLYPLVLDTENFTIFSGIPISATILKILRYLQQPGTFDPTGNPPDAYDQVDEFKILVADLASGTLISIVTLHTLYDIDNFQLFGVTLVSGTLVVIIIATTLYDIDTFKLNVADLTSGLLELIVITHSLYDIDTFKLNTAIPFAGSSLV